MRDAALTAGMVLFMVAASNLLSQAIVIDGLGRTLAKAFAALHSPTEFLFVTVVVMIVVGFMLEGIPAILIAAPILLPIATRVGVDPLQYGIVLTMAVGIGVFLPPVGIGYYIACAIGEAPVNATMRPSLIYSVFLVLGLVIVVSVSAGITIWVPHHVRHALTQAQTGRKRDATGTNRLHDDAAWRASCIRRRAPPASPRRRSRSGRACCAMAACCRRTASITGPA